MTYQEALALPKGTRVHFGNHPQVWTFFHYSQKRDAFAFTRPNGPFLKPIEIPPQQLKNVHVIEEKTV